MLEPELQRDTDTLERLGLSELAAQYQRYLASGGPRNADAFLAWLQDQGLLDGGALGSVHAARPVDLIGLPRALQRIASRAPGEQQFEFLGLLGRGGMGEVLLARERDLRRPVALKVLASDIDDEVVGRFLTEATITAQLDHPNIVPVYGLEKMRNGQPALAMKLVSGRTFQEICDGDDVDGPTRLEYFLEACSAVHYAHDRGVLHRDLKPENLMVGGHREVYVVDWGIAKIIGSSQTDETAGINASGGITQTQAGKVLGTPAYLSPEQAMAEPMGPASDQYALGLVLYELVCGRRANPGVNVPTAVAHAMAGSIRPIEPIGMPRPGELAAIIRRATECEPEDRYATVDELATDLRRYLRGEVTLARPDNLPRAVIRWSRAHPLILWGLLTLTTVLAGVLLIVGLSSLILLQGHAAAREAALTEAISVVTHRGQTLNSELVRLSGLAGGLAKAAERHWHSGRADGRPAYGREAFEAGEVPGLSLSSVYEKPISTDHSLIWRPEGSGPELEDEALRVAPLHDMLADAALRSHSETAARWAPSRQRAVIASEGVPVTLAYVAYENGLYLEYPGAPGLRADYDARERPWYEGNHGNHGPSWGAPYSAASGLGLLVPVRAAMYGPDGSFLGVAGLTLLMDGIIEQMTLSELDHVVDTFLLDPSGEVLVARTVLETGATAPHDATPEILASLRSGETAGSVHADGHLFIFVRLEATGWTYVAEIAELDTW